jgi:signal transduction histidine kinase/CheY-like chemotaxis protein
MSLLGKWWSLLSNLGVTSSLTYSESRRVRIHNRIAFISIIGGLPYVFNYLDLNAPGPALVQAMTVLCSALVWILNHRRNYQLARHLYLLVWNFNLVITSNFFGLGSGEHFPTFPLILITFLIFDVRQRWSLLIWVLLSTGPLVVNGYIGLHIFDPLYPVRPEDIYLQNWTVNYLLSIWIGYYFQKISSQQLLDVIEKSHRELQAIFDHSYDAVLIADPLSLRVLSANQQAQHYFAPEGQPLEKHLLTEILRPVAQEMSTTLRKGIRRWSCEAQLSQGGSDPFWGHIAFSEVEIGDEKRLLVRISDISEQKEVEKALLLAKEKAEEATAAKSQFLSTMSHEIRTPMNAVIGLTGLLLETSLSEEQREFTETIRMSGENLLTIINDILDFSKIESGKMELDQHTFLLREPMEDVMDLLALRARDKGLELMYWIDPSAPQALVSDSTRLKQILLNLGSNAIKFTDQGEVVFSVSYLGEEEGKHRIQFSVQDTGIGIPEEKLHRLFQSFSQVDASTTRKYGGTGLGLAICKNLVQMMGGTIWVNSTPGLGTTFYFTVLVPAGDPEKAEKAIQALQKDPSVRGRVLLVDDNLTNLAILRRQCGRLGLETEECSNPLLALDLLQRRSFDLGILDMHMPEMDGLMLARQIRRSHSKEQLPLILLSSIGEQIPEASQWFEAVLTKPARQDTLLRVIMHYLLHRGASAEQAPPPPPLPEKAAAPAETFRILIAEDNLVNQKVALRILEKLGFKADVASNGMEAVKAVDMIPYNIVFMDMQMPEMDGLQATREIRQRIPDQDKRPVIIAMTANAMAEDRENCLAAGMDDYLSKPIKKEQVEEMLDKWSERARALLREH